MALNAVASPGPLAAWQAVDAAGGGTQSMSHNDADGGSHGDHESEHERDGARRHNVTSIHAGLQFDAS